MNFPASFANPWRGFPAAIRTRCSSAENAPFIRSGSYENFVTDPKTTYSQQWNLSIQRQLGADWLVTANYAGNNTIHVWGGDQRNPGVVIPGIPNVGSTDSRCTQTTLAVNCVTNVNARRVLNLQNAAPGAFWKHFAVGRRRHFRLQRTDVFGAAPQLEGL